MGFAEGAGSSGRKIAHLDGGSKPQSQNRGLGSRDPGSNSGSATD